MVIKISIAKSSVNSRVHHSVIVIDFRHNKLQYMSSRRGRFPLPIVSCVHKRMERILRRRRLGAPVGMLRAQSSGGVGRSRRTGHQHRCSRPPSRPAQYPRPPQFLVVIVMHVGRHLNHITATSTTTSTTSFTITIANNEDKNKNKDENKNVIKITTITTKSKRFNTHGNDCQLASRTLTSLPASEPQKLS